MNCLNSKASRSFAVGAKALGRNSEKANLKHSRQFLDFGKLIQYCLSAHPCFFSVLSQWDSNMAEISFQTF